ncbi:MAG: tetratricopeptide repeat protein [Deltaproteobacteria bacterium]|nr:tetratricopeptide repeat protein [Deltaproteobacteria bacterium]
MPRPPTDSDNRVVALLERYGRNEITLEALLGAGPALKAACVERAEHLIHAERYDDAAQILNGLCHLEPNNATYWAWRGWLGTQQSQPDGAIECYRRAVELEPSVNVYRARLIEAQLAAGRLDDAAAELKTLLDRDPKCADPATAWARQLARSAAHRLGVR